MIKREELIDILQKMQEKDFATLIQTVETAQANEEKARIEFKNANPARVTLQQYRDSEMRWRLAYQKRLTDLTSFFEFFTGKSKQFNGRSFVRRPKVTGKILEKNGELYIEFGAVGAGQESEHKIELGESIELNVNNVWVPIKITQTKVKDKTCWHGVGLLGLSLVGRVARL